MIDSQYPQLNDHEWLRKRREEEFATFVDIAQEVGCHPDAAKRAVKRAGLPLGRIGSARSKFPQLNDRVWLEQQLEDKTLRAIAKEVGCGPTPVRDAAIRLGITIPERAMTISAETREKMKQGLKARYPNGRFGPNASNWRGGRRKQHGYIFVYAPDHPRASQRGTVQEHILVMEKKLGRYLEPGEIVHHRNHVKDDNRPENLYLTKNGTHIAEHFAEGKRASDAEARVAELEAELARLKGSASG